MTRADRQVEPAAAQSSRPLTYADSGTIRYGDHTVEFDGPVVELDVTEEGIGFRTDDGQIWFTDGSTVDRLGALGETGPGLRDPWPLTSHPGWMLSSNTGSRLVWFDFPVPGQPGVAVDDTGPGKEVSRDTRPAGTGSHVVPEVQKSRFIS